MEAKRIRYPIGIQTFRNIVEGGYLYIDKTGFVHDLAENYKYVFLSRPRRFGKSLLSSTIHSYFAGEAELFNGLKAGELKKEWMKHLCSILICQRLSIWTRMRSGRSTRKDIWFRTGLRGRIVLRQAQRPAGYSSRSEWISPHRPARLNLGKSPKSKQSVTIHQQPSESCQ